MEVSINQTRHDCLSFEVNTLRVEGSQILELSHLPHGSDLVLLDTHGFGMRERWITRVNMAIIKQEIEHNIPQDINGDCTPLA
jgi:hypothetical protein